MFCLPRNGLRSSADSAPPSMFRISFEYLSSIFPFFFCVETLSFSFRRKPITWNDVQSKVSLAVVVVAVAVIVVALFRFLFARLIRR